MDRLASKGVLFTRAISNGPVTDFSFPAIFTSTYPLMHKVESYAVRLSKNYITLAEALRRAGYSTLGFLSSNPFLSSYFGYDVGFKYFDEDKRSHQRTTWIGFFKRIMALQKHLCRLSGKYCLIRALLTTLLKSHKNATYYLVAEKINERILSKLRKRSFADKFFLAVHYMDVHTPYLQSIKYLSKLRNSMHLFRDSLKIHYKISHNQSSIDDEDKCMAMLLYDAAIQYVDRCIFSLLSELEKEGIGLDNTYVIITSDHGEGFREHNFFGHKAQLFDELLHVPLIVCGPHIKPKIVDDLIGLIDIAPTILELVQVKPPRGFLGKSVVPLLLGDEENRGRKYVISEVFSS